MNAIKKFREGNGITKKWLARQLGISRSALWRYERGYVQPPKSVIFHAASLLHVSPEELTNEINK